MTLTPDDLIRIREDRGWNRTQAAEAVGVARNTWRAYEDGAKPVPPIVALALAAVLHGLPPLKGYRRPSD